MKYATILLSLFLATSATAGADRRVELSVPGMNCPTCPITVRKSLERIDGVTVNSADLETRRVVVTAPGSVTDDALLNAVRNAGYPNATTATVQGAQ